MDYHSINLTEQSYFTVVYLFENISEAADRLLEKEVWIKRVTCRNGGEPSMIFLNCVIKSYFLTIFVNKNFAVRDKIEQLV